MKLIYNRYRGEKTIYYYDDVIALDIETSTNELYTWISSIQCYFQKQFYLFRKPAELMDFLNEIIERYDLFLQKRLMIIIHNASFDLSYLIGYFQKYLPDKNDRTCVLREKHNIVSYRQGGLEFRDTYALVNTSLEKWGNDLNVEHKKQVGLYDYSKTIYQDSILTDDEIKYDEYDVLCLYECFLKQLEIHKDTIATVPFTSTGYVRRDTQRICQKEKYYRKTYFEKNRLDLDLFRLCNKSFSGGYTHNNRFYVDTVINAKIGHRDFRSEYPSELRCYPLPFGKPHIIFDVNNVFRCEPITLKDIINLYPEYSTITELRIKSAILKDKKISMPFLQHAKMDIEHEKTEKCLKDNGRILTFVGDAVICVDNHTLKILMEQYKMECMILRVLSFKNEYLPECLKNLIDTYFKLKSDLKNQWKEYKKLYGEHDERTIETAINMLLSKQKLNGIYGMFVQNPLHDDYDIDYANSEFIKQSKIEELEDSYLEDKLNQYYSNRNKMLPYQVGCFVTALARYELYEYIKTIGYENVLYCDTDSIFYIKTDEIEKRIEKLNYIKHLNAEKLGAFITTESGDKIYYDVFEPEEDIKQFIGLHSKCYGYVTEEKNEFSCTIAGVPSRTLINVDNGKLIYLTREEELSGITKEQKIKNPDIKIDIEKALKNLKESFIFKVNTGTTCNYDNYMLREEITVDIDGHKINTFGGCLIKKLDAKQIMNMDLEDVEAFRNE